MSTVSKKKKKKKTECVCACDCVPEEPDVYDYKDMLCSGLCDRCALLEQEYWNASLRSPFYQISTV